MLKLQGIFPSIATPFDHHGNIYKSKVHHNVEKWNLTKLAGYVVASSTGEGVHLTAEEKVALWGLVAERAAEGRLLIAATGVESVRETVTLANQAAGLAYKAALVRTPSFYRNVLDNAASLELFFNAVADQCKIPVVIDNCPEITGIDIPFEAVIRLSAHPNIVALKENSGNLDRVNQLLRAVKPGFQILEGTASLLAASLSAGAVGAVLGFASAAPYACITIWEAFRTREHEAAADWQLRITGPAALVTSKFGIPGLKYAMDLNGYYGGPCRLPLAPISPAAKLEIEDAFAPLKG